MRDIKSFLNKVKLVHKSRLAYKKGLSAEEIRRLDICKVCPLNSDNNSKGVIIKAVNKLANKVYGIKTTVDAVCTRCGCNLELKAKTDNCDKWNLQQTLEK